MDKIDNFPYKNQRKIQMNLLLKRLFDIMTSFLLIIFLFPVFILLSMILLVFSGPQVLFKQVRTGRYNEPFIIWKYRTIVSNTKVGNIHRYYWTDGVPDDFIFQTPATQKITAIGKVYRKLSIDELPQLFNVLKGEMSLVGPRPEIPEITKLYNDKQRIRLQMKPGITGYAQVNGRSIINHGKKIEYDLYYIEHYSLLLDLKIIGKTIGQVIRGKGAY